jgi:hypothetical protein
MLPRGRLCGNVVLFVVASVTWLCGACFAGATAPDPRLELLAAASQLKFETLRLEGQFTITHDAQPDKLANAKSEVESGIDRQMAADPASFLPEELVALGRSTNFTAPEVLAALKAKREEQVSRWIKVISREYGGTEDAYFGTVLISSTGDRATLKHPEKGPPPDELPWTVTTTEICRQDAQLFRIHPPEGGGEVNIEPGVAAFVPTLKGVPLRIVGKPIDTEDLEHTKVTRWREYQEGDVRRIEVVICQDLTHGTGVTVHMIVEPDFGYRARYLAKYVNGMFELGWECSDWVELRPGAYFPKMVTYRRQLDRRGTPEIREKLRSGQIRIEDVEALAKIPTQGLQTMTMTWDRVADSPAPSDDELKLEVPAGTRIIDRRASGFSGQTWVTKVPRKL